MEHNLQGNEGENQERDQQRDGWKHGGGRGEGTPGLSAHLQKQTQVMGPEVPPLPEPQAAGQPSSALPSGHILSPPPSAAPQTDCLPASSTPPCTGGPLCPAPEALADLTVRVSPVAAVLHGNSPSPSPLEMSISNKASPFQRQEFGITCLWRKLKGRRGGKNAFQWKRGKVSGLVGLEVVGPGQREEWASLWLVRVMFVFLRLVPSWTQRQL